MDPAVPVEGLETLSTVEKRRGARGRTMRRHAQPTCKSSFDSKTGAKSRQPLAASPVATRRANKRGRRAVLTRLIWGQGRGWDSARRLIRLGCGGGGALVVGGGASGGAQVHHPVRVRPTCRHARIRFAGRRRLFSADVTDGESRCTPFGRLDEKDGGIRLGASVQVRVRRTRGIVAVLLGGWKRRPGGEKFRCTPLMLGTPRPRDVPCHALHHPLQRPVDVKKKAPFRRCSAFNCPSVKVPPSSNEIQTLRTPQADTLVRWWSGEDGRITKHHPPPEDGTNGDFPPVWDCSKTKKKHYIHVEPRPPPPLHIPLHVHSTSQTPPPTRTITPHTPPPPRPQTPPRSPPSRSPRPPSPATPDSH